MAIPTRIDMTLAKSSGTVTTGGGVLYIIETPNGVIYRVYMESSTSDPVFDKSTDYGISWSAPTQLKAITITQISVWYDRWTDPTGVLGDLIHVVYTDQNTADVFYRTIDTSNSDSLGTERTVFSGTSTAIGGAISISRMRGANVIVAGSIDAGTENFAYKTADLGANWTSIANPYEASPDKLIMMPGWGGAGDENDAMCFYYDNDGQEVSVKYYDDSGDSWAETSIATTIVHPNHTSSTLGHWAATVDHTNSQNLIAFWTAVDTAGADLRVFKCTQSAQVETASNVVLNSADDQGFCAIAIFGSSWYVFYGGKSDGTEVINTAINLYYKVSGDGGINWSSETRLGYVTHYIMYLFTCPICYKNYYLISMETLGTFINFNAPIAITRTNYQLGM